MGDLAFLAKWLGPEDSEGTSLARSLGRLGQESDFMSATPPSRPFFISDKPGLPAGPIVSSCFTTGIGDYVGTGLPGAS